MDLRKIKQSAIDLERIATRYALTDQQVKLLLGALNPLIQSAKAESITKLTDNVPGEYWLQKGSLAQYSDLEAAYYNFKIAITIGDTQQYRDFMVWAENQKKQMFPDKN